MFKKILNFILIHFYAKLYGKIKIFSDLKSKNIKKIVLDKLISDTFPEKKYHLYEVTKGRIYTDSIENVAIIENNKLIPGTSFQQIDGKIKSSNFNIVLQSGTPRFKKKKDGTVLSLVQGASGNNYFHFLFDVIPRLRMCEEIYDLNKISYFYVPGIFNWQKKIFEVFGIQKDRLINSKKNKHIEADKIIAVDHPWYHSGVIHSEVENLPNWIVFWLRNKFINLAAKFDNCDKIFIDRSESDFKHCQLQNNDEMIDFLSTKGFKSYKVGQLDFFEQIYLFKNAKTIIGPHGAAFTNIIFCKPKTNIIEIIPDNHPNKKCIRISKVLDLNHYRLITPELQNNSEKVGDLNFSIEKMDEIIKNIN